MQERKVEKQKIKSDIKFLVELIIKNYNFY